MKKAFNAIVTSALLAFASIGASYAQQPKVAATLMTNANIFDGKSDKLAMSISVLVEGNPLENLDLVTDPGKNFAVVMKDGKIYKNAL